MRHGVIQPGPEYQQAGVRQKIGDLRPHALGGFFQLRRHGLPIPRKFFAFINSQGAENLRVIILDEIAELGHLLVRSEWRDPILYIPAAVRQAEDIRVRSLPGLRVGWLARLVLRVLRHKSILERGLAEPTGG